MIAILHILIFLFFFSFVAGLDFRMLRQVKKTPILEANIVIIIFLLGFNILSFALVTDFYELNPTLTTLRLDSMACGILAFSSIALTVMARMQLATSKKMRTLLRLPVIGALIGFYFKDERILYLFVGIELVLTVYFCANRGRYNYVFRQQAKAFIGILVFFILFLNDLTAFSLIGLFIFILMKNQIINQIKLKLILEKSQNDI